MKIYVVVFLIIIVHLQVAYGQKSVLRNGIYCTLRDSFMGWTREIKIYKKKFEYRSPGCTGGYYEKGKFYFSNDSSAIIISKRRILSLRTPNYTNDTLLLVTLSDSIFLCIEGFKFRTEISRNNDIKLIDNKGKIELRKGYRDYKGVLRQRRKIKRKEQFSSP